MGERSGQPAAEVSAVEQDLPGSPRPEEEAAVRSRAEADVSWLLSHALGLRRIVELADECSRAGQHGPEPGSAG